MSHQIVFIVDDDPVVRETLRFVIEQHGIAVAPFDSAEAFLDTFRLDYRGCAIIDILMPGMDGLQLQDELSRRGSRLPIIFLAGHADLAQVVKAVKNGAVDFLAKPIASDMLIKSVLSAFLEGEKILTQTEAHQHALCCIESLTQREREVMALAIEGYHNKEIARKLGISYRTVEIHRAHLMHKTGAHTLLDLARMAQSIEFHPYT